MLGPWPAPWLGPWPPRTPPGHWPAGQRELGSAWLELRRNGFVLVWGKLWICPI